MIDQEQIISSNEYMSWIRRIEDDNQMLYKQNSILVYKLKSILALTYINKEGQYEAEDRLMEIRGISTLYFEPTPRQRIHHQLTEMFIDKKKLNTSPTLSKVFHQLLE